MIALTKPLFAPRAYLGFCFFVGLLASIEVEKGKWLIINKLFVFVFVYSLLSYSNSYGNALKYQNKYWEHRSIMLINDLSKLTSSKEITVHFSGKVGRSKALLNASNHLPLIKRLVPAKAGGWRFLNLEHSGLTLTKSKEYFNVLKKCDKDTPKKTLLNTIFYDIEKGGDCFYVTFK